MLRASDLQVTYTAKGHPRYVIEIWHEGLNKYQAVKGKEPHVVKQKAKAKLSQWEDMWERKQERERKKKAREAAARDKERKKALAAEQTEEAQEALSELEEVLALTLDVDDVVDWETLKDHSEFSEPRPTSPIHPHPPRPPKETREPRKEDPKYQPKLGILDRILPSRRKSKEAESSALFQSDWQTWKKNKDYAAAAYTKAQEEHDAKVKDLHAEHKSEVRAWEERRDIFLKEQEETNASIDALKAQYKEGQPDAVLEYCDLVLSQSEYPDYFPQEFELEYRPASRILIVDYQLPDIADIPTLKEVRYIQSRDEFKEKHISDAQRRRTYDSLLYQITLRTVHELFEADVIDALGAVVFNGYVDSLDPATGNRSNSCVLSLQASKDEFLALNLAHIDPKACFKKLKGVGSSKLHSLTPVAPIMDIDRSDGRFTEGRHVAVQEGDNLAAMDWEDFEHLIRQLFEEEFSQSGGEVKVTQASRDGGVDAIAFDPDPIRGGKIVIQAKRYTNTVGVAAVRDLYGTVMNEGAIKGILVTTSDYGPDAYDFAKGKPITLMNGGNLLHLLERHGHKARIDIKEARLQ